MPRVGLVRNHIIHNGHHFGMAVGLRNFKDSAQAGCQKSQPVPNNNQVGLFPTQAAANFEPIQRINGIDHRFDLQILGCRIVGVLGFTRKQNGGVL